MGVNLAEINQNINRLIQNMSEQNRRAYQIFYDPLPQDVSLPQLDENGNLVTVTIPNRAKIKKQMWDDVGAATGLWNRTFYVDATNGDDSNPGTEDAPFRTIEKAIKSIPAGGTGYIYLNSDVSLISFISIPFKVIRIYLQGHNFNVTTDSTSILHYINLSQGGIIIFDGNSITGSKITLPSPASDTTNIDNHPYLITSGYQGGGFAALHLVYGVEVVVNDSHYGLLEIKNKAGFFSVDSTSKLTDNTGSGLTWGDLISGIVKDSNGIPRNIVSNIVL